MAPSEEGECRLILRQAVQAAERAYQRANAVNPEGDNSELYIAKLETGNAYLRALEKGLEENQPTKADVEAVAAATHTVSQRLITLQTLNELLKEMAKLAEAATKLATLFI